MPQLAEVISLARQIKAAGDIAQIKHIAGRIARGDCADTVRNDAEFKESDHPRAEDGKFGSGAGNSKHISSVEKRATYIMPGKHDGIVKGEKVWRLPDAPDYFLSKDGNYFKDEGNGITKKLKSTSKESVIQHIENRDIERQKEKEKASEPNNKFIDSAAKFAKERGMEYRIERPNDASSRYMYLETKFGTKKIRIADHPQPTFFNSDTQKYETRGGYDKKGVPHDPADYSFTTGDNPADVHKIISALAKGEEPISYGKGWNKGESEWDVRKRVIQGLSEETSSDSANPSSPKDQIIQALRKIVGEEVRNDADHWITVNSGHGEGGGTPALIGEDGTVKGGMGGKFNGLNIKDAHGEGLKARDSKRSKDAEKHGKLTEGNDAPEKNKTANLSKEIQKLGGINTSHAKDILGDNPKGEWKFAFSKEGKSIDDLATQLKDKGFDIDTSTVDGGVQQLRDMIRDHSDGQAEFKHGDITSKAERERYHEMRDGLEQNAVKKGINVTRNMTASQINAALDYHDARVESDSLGIKTNAQMQPDEIYRLVEAEMQNRAEQAQREMSDRHESELAKQRELQQSELIGAISPETLSMEEMKKEWRGQDEGSPKVEEKTETAQPVKKSITKQAAIKDYVKYWQRNGDLKSVTPEGLDAFASGIQRSSKVTDDKLKQISGYGKKFMGREYFSMEKLEEMEKGGIIKDVGNMDNVFTDEGHQILKAYLEGKIKHGEQSPTTEPVTMRPEPESGHVEHKIPPPLLTLTGQTNAEINEQKAKQEAADKQQKEDERLVAKVKYDKDVADFKSKLNDMASNADNFKFGEDSKAASKPMGSLFA